MKHNQNGSILTIVLLVVSVLLLFTFLGLFIWAFEGMQNYKNNTTQIVSQAVDNAKKNQLSIDNKNFAIQSELPLVSYVGPEEYGSLTVYYPKNWSGYVDTSGNSNYPIDGYFFPGVLPSVSDSSTINFALRIRIDPQSYSNVLQGYINLEQSNLVKVTTFSLPKVPSVIGVEVTGQMMDNNLKQSTDIILPLRNETLEIWTEGNQFINTFDSQIIPNISFSP